jgi:hypothetical protein
VEETKSDDICGKRTLEEPQCDASIIPAGRLTEHKNFLRWRTTVFLPNFQKASRQISDPQAIPQEAGNIQMRRTFEGDKTNAY